MYKYFLQQNPIDLIQAAMQFLAQLFFFILPLIGCNFCSEWKLDNHTVLVETKWNMGIFVDAQDRGLSNRIRETGGTGDNGGYYDGFVEFVTRFIGQNRSYVHVGAHIGVQMLLVAKYAQQHNLTNFHIHTFQPSHKNYILLTKSAQVNNLQHLVTIYKASVTDRIGSAELAIRNEDTSLADIIQNSTTKRKADYKYQVDTVTIDSVLKGKQGQGEGKIEREGFGMVYLGGSYGVEGMLGMRGLLGGNREVGVLVDWGFSRNGHKNVDGLITMLDYFKANSYRLFTVNLSVTQPPVPVSQKHHQIADWMQITKLPPTKLLFIPSSKIHLIQIQ